MKHTKTILLTAAAVLMFDCCMIIFAWIFFRSMRGPMPEIVLFDRPEVSGSVVSVGDICAWEHLPCMYITSACWQNGDPDLPLISADQQTISVGNKCGVLEVTVADAPDIIIPENTVTVIVGQPQ